MHFAPQYKTRYPFYRWVGRYFLQAKTVYNFATLPTRNTFWYNTNNNKASYNMWVMQVQDFEIALQNLSENQYACKHPIEI